MEVDSSCENALYMEKYISLVMRPVSMPSFSNATAIPNIFSSRTASIGAVSSESGNGFNQYAVNPPSSAVPHHPLEIIALVGSGTGYALVGIDVNEFPIAVGLYQLGEIFDLRGKGVQLIIGVAAHTGIGTNPDFLFLWSYRRFYDLHLWHSPHRPFCAFLGGIYCDHPAATTLPQRLVQSYHDNH